MELKKSEKANLEKKRNILFLFGLVLALGTVLLAFEWKSSPRKADDLGTLNSIVIEDNLIPVTREKDIQPPPPPPPPKTIEVLNIVENDEIIENELEMESTEADESTVIDAVPVIELHEEEEEAQEVYLNIMEDPAEFPGGKRALYKYISTHVRYPVIAQENGIQGKVYVKFIVNETGSITNAHVLRGVDPSLDNEALRVINSLPEFKPGRQRGRAVKVYYNAVINFTLQ